MPIMPIDTNLLPSWAVFNEPANEIRVEIDIAYPHYLKMAGLAESAYNVGACRLCITRDLRDLFGEGGDGPFPMVRFLPLATKKDATDEEREESRQRWRAENLPNYGKPLEEDIAGMQNGGRIRQRLMQRRAAAALALE